MAKFKMAKDFEHQLKRAIDGGMKDLAQEWTQTMERLAIRYEGRPVQEIKPILKREWERNGGTITDPELAEIAQMISTGTRIEFRYDG